VAFFTSRIVLERLERPRAAAGLQHSRGPFFKLAAVAGLLLTICVSESAKPRRAGPPHNPGVRELVDVKRRWSSPPKTDNLKKRFHYWHERGYLPHRDEPGLTQFVTFRLYDSFPESLRSEWQQLWEIEDDSRRRAELEAYLDKGAGHCYLRQPEVSRIVEDAFRFFDGVRYNLRAWVIMPNQVHVLFKIKTTSMAEIVESWKKYTAQKINRLLKRRGAFWAKDYFDTFIRNEEHERKTKRYIENNPSKAKLVLDPKEWLWSSAHLRDEYGRLRF
jgi:putative transposase